MSSGFLESLKLKLEILSNKANNNIYLLSIRDGFLYSMPLIIVSSFFTLFVNLPLTNWDKIMTNILGPNWKIALSAPANAITNIISILSVLSISYRLAKRKKIDAFQVSIISLVAYFIVTPFYTEIVNESGMVTSTIESLPLRWMGANGLFLAIFISIMTVNLYVFIKNKNLVINLPKSVPKEVSESFSALIPSCLIVVLFTIINFILLNTNFKNLHELIYTILQVPMLSLGNSIGMILMSVILTHLFWFLGINGTSIISSVYGPILAILSIENFKKFEVGHIPTNVINGQFEALFTTIGGVGSTLSLILILIFLSRSKELKKLGKLALIPGIFGINEPIVYGLPIVLNTKLLVPFVMVPTVNTVIAYLLIYFKVVPCTNGVQIPWTTPPIISGFILQGWKGALLQVLLIIVSMIIYYPFIKRIDLEKFKLEKLSINLDREEEI